MSPTILYNAPQWQPYLARHQAEWRTSIFLDLLLAEAEHIGPNPTFLDIGCGGGFDNDSAAQQILASRCSRYIGIEPDADIGVDASFHEVHRCRLEESPIEPGSVDLAWSVMVLEHIDDPGKFFDKVRACLSDRGVFWAFTVDRRHPFPAIVQLLGRLGLKERYLAALRRDQNGAQYLNYPTRYRCNSPGQIGRHIHAFRRCDFLNFARVGQLDGYLPVWARGLAHAVDRIQIAMKLPGVLLAVRCEA